MIGQIKLYILLFPVISGSINVLPLLISLPIWCNIVQSVSV